jgi:hypothetical protein
MNNLKYTKEENPGLHEARHKGMNTARYNYLVYCDDDVFVSSRWLENIALSFTNSGVVLVGGKILPWFESSVPGWFKNLWNQVSYGKVLGFYSLIDFGNQIKEIDPGYVYGCNFSIRKDIIVKAGGFHPDGMPSRLLILRGDGETYISEYIKKNTKYKTIFNPGAKIYHMISKDRLTLNYLYKRAFAQGISQSYSKLRARYINKLKSVLKYSENTFFYNLKFPDIKYWTDTFFGFIAVRLLDSLAATNINSRKITDFIIKKGISDGYAFHQKEFNKNKVISGWVTKKVYLS